VVRRSALKHRHDGVGLGFESRDSRNRLKGSEEVSLRDERRGLPILKFVGRESNNDYVVTVGGKKP